MIINVNKVNLKDSSEIEDITAGTLLLYTSVIYDTIAERKTTPIDKKSLQHQIKYLRAAIHQIEWTFLDEEGQKPGMC